MRSKRGAASVGGLFHLARINHTTLSPILDGLPTGPRARFPDVTSAARRTRTGSDRAFVPYLGSRPPSVDHARAANRSMTPRTAAVSGSSRADAGKDHHGQNYN